MKTKSDWSHRARFKLDDSAEEIVCFSKQYKMFMFKIVNSNSINTTIQPMYQGFLQYH